MATGLAAIGGAIKGIWAAMTPKQKGAVVSLGVETARLGIKKAGERDMRDEKRQRLFGREGRIRTTIWGEGGIFNPYAVKERRQKRRDAIRGFLSGDRRPSAGQISGNAAQESAPVFIPPNLGRNLPGPGEPGSRRQVFGAGAPATAPSIFDNPLAIAAVVGGTYFLFFRKKK